MKQTEIEATAFLLALKKKKINISITSTIQPLLQAKQNKALISFLFIYLFDFYNFYYATICKQKRISKQNNVVPTVEFERIDR